MIEPRLLSPDQAAAYLGLGSRWAVYRLVKSRELPAVVLAGKLRIDLTDLDRLIEAKKQDPEQARREVHVYRSPRPRSSGLAPLAPRSPKNGDNSVTGPQQVRIASAHPARRPDISSVLPVTKEGH